MSSGIVVLRAFRNLVISNSLKYPSNRLTAGIHQVHSRLCSTNESTEEEKPPSRFHQPKSEEKDPKDRSIKIPVATSIRYLKSRAYAATYKDEPVWVPYRRNFKGRRPPWKTRESCIRSDRLATNNPCPICRDEYLVLHETNVDLLKQFISPFTGEILGWSTTNLCRRQHHTLMVCILRARDQGLLTYDVPFRRYDYDQYKPKDLPKATAEQSAAL